ncbi:MAG TPA: phosphodiester glycosidase family protein [Gemmatimonadaceae bacterium]|nr:phosphodiester glycosidase family protein [Gemmatimonadaceae bacterium]
MPVVPFPTDTVRAQVLQHGVTHWFVYARSGPWAINALVIDRDACYSALAVKGADGAIGREKTSVILERLRASADVVGGVNADFFLFAPPGVPTNLLVSRGRVVTGPSTQPVLAFDSVGTPHLTTFRVEGGITTTTGRLAIAAWNRAAPSGIALYDDAWGGSTDTLSGAVEVVLDRLHAGRITRIDTLTSGVAVRAGQVVLVGRGSEARAALLALGIGDSVGVQVALRPFHPMEALGGRPLLLRDSAIVAGLDTAGGPGFAAGRHPRTAVGIASDGRRLMLVVVDGRQKPYSDGMTLRELAELMRGLGARDAINLDGGGSTTLVHAEPRSVGPLRIANRPSDPAGERPVGDALAIVRGCAPRH